MRNGLVRWMWIAVVAGAGVAAACGSGTNNDLNGGDPGGGDTPDTGTLPGTSDDGGDPGTGINSNGCRSRHRRGHGPAV